jgi:hypothetical protein
MAEISLFSKFLHWLQSTEMFARPSKQLPGKWELIEYYTESKDELIHMKGDDLPAFNHHWNIELKPDGTSKHEVNLNHIFKEQLIDASWINQKNFIIFLTESGIEEQFQFAVTSQQLKLLKKDAAGAIVFFGFFNRIN